MVPVGYYVARKVRYLGRWLRHGGWYPEWRMRLFDRRRARSALPVAGSGRPGGVG